MSDMSNDYSDNEADFGELNVKDLREDSIKTDQINKMIENEKKDMDSEVEEYSYHDEES